MKFTVDSHLLNAALRLLTPALSSNSIMPILDNVHCEIKSNKLFLTVTNLNTTITSNVKCEASKDFDMLLPFKQVLKITSELGAQPIIIDDSETLTLTGIEDKYKLGKREDVINFPIRPTVEEKLCFDIDADVLDLFQLSKNFLLKDSNGLRYTDIYFRVDKGELNIVTTDGFQVFKGSETIDNIPDYSAVINANFINSIKGVRSGKITADEKCFTFKNDTISISCGLTEEKVLPYWLYFKEHDYNCKISKSHLLSAINKLMVFDNSFYWVNLHFSEAGITIKYANNDTEENYETLIPCTHSVDFEKITFNAAQLKNVISAIPDEEINIYFPDAKNVTNIDSKEINLSLVISPIHVND